MNHGGGSTTASACVVSMLWNWTTIDACFLAGSWQIKNNGMMAASCIGTAFLVILLEALRRLGKEYDNHLLSQFQRRAAFLSAGGSTLNEKNSCSVPNNQPTSLVFRASALQQIARSVLYAVTFGVAYIVMLLAMYFNGYIIISIVIGAGLGKFFCDWFEVKLQVSCVSGKDAAPATATGTTETTFCCS